MKLPRLPRINLAKLVSDDPSDRRPEIDRLGDSLVGGGAVRLLIPSKADRGVGSLGRHIRVGFGGLEAYFGLLPGRLLNGIGAPTDQGDALSPRISDEPDVVGEFLSAPNGRLVLRYPTVSNLEWLAKEDELLWIVGPRLVCWTASVLARPEGIRFDPPPNGASKRFQVATAAGGAAAPMSEFGASRGSI